MFYPFFYAKLSEKANQILVDISTESELEHMHIYGVGTKGKIGSSVKQLLDTKFNPERGRRTGSSYEKSVIPATINSEITQAKLTLDGNRVSAIHRPFVTVESEIRDVWGDISDNVNHTSFLAENRPTMTYIYPLHDEEIKGLVDAGLYRNPRFEALFGKLMETERYELSQDITVQSIEMIPEEEDGVVLPMILVHDVGLVEQSMDESETVYTSFGTVIERTVEMALRLESEGIRANAIIGDGPEMDEEMEVEVENVFDVKKVSEQINNQAWMETENDADEREIVMTDTLTADNLFGQSTEDQRIIQMKEEAEMGTGASSEDVWINHDDEYDKKEIPAGVLVDMDDMVLEEKEEIRISKSNATYEDDEIEL